MSCTKQKKNNRRSPRVGRRCEAKQVENRKSLKSVLNWLLPDDSIFANCKFHGNVSWKPKQLVAQALCWSWQETKNVTTAFDYCLEVCEALGAQEIAQTYPTFMNALGRYQVSLGACLDQRFETLAEHVGGRFWRDHDWVLMGFDGSRVSVPRTVSNEQAFCAANYGHGTTAKYRKKKSKGMRRKQNEKHKPAPPKPQVWITMFWHMNLQLPWRWRLGPSDSGEREHVMEMLEQEEMPDNTLYCGDAGFVGYPLWSSILVAGGNFLIRVGGNVSLLGQQADFKQGKDGIVWCWPKDKMNSGAQPLKLRLVQVKIGKTKMWMLTSILSGQKLSAKRILKYYQMRWGIEVEFRSLKQTLEHSKLRCRESERVLVELEWSISGRAVAKLLALCEQISTEEEQAPENTPSNLSLANTMQALRDCMRNAHKVPSPGHELRWKLATALIQRYHARTDKKARYRPANPDKKPLGKPKIRKLTKEIRAKIREVGQLAA
jgi:hypothetical protein